MRFILFLFIILTITVSAQSQNILIPMDKTQNDHLRAYGLVYWCLQSPRIYKTEWLLNYRGGSFLVEDHPDVRQQATLMGVSIQPVSPTEVNMIYQTIDSGNMEAVLL
ncbi:asparagine synthetase B, partial [Candidatus Poribacteria bacterium]|nr:asparagine synthetase B [Candidatus Poribacteria bacterium]